MAFNLHAQQVTYNAKDGHRHKYFSEEFDLCFEKTVKMEGAGTVALMSAFVPAAIKAGFQWADSLISRNAKKYKAEYPYFRSHLDAANGKIPGFTFRRNIRLGNEWKPALEISFKADTVDGFENAIVYYVDSITLNYADAKVKKGDRLDYTITLSPVIFMPDEKQQAEKTLTIAPFTIHSVGAGVNKYEPQKHRTQIVVLPKKAWLLGMSISVAETNPRGVKAEKLLENWNTYSDEIKTGVVDPLGAIWLTNMKQANDEETAWKTATSKATKAAYQKYLDEYPFGKYSKTAKEKIVEIDKRGFVGSNQNKN